MESIGIIFEEVRNDINSIQYIENPDTKTGLLKIYDYNNPKELFENLIRLSIRDPKNKIMFYSKELDKFFGIFKKRLGHKKYSNDFEVKEVDFNNDNNVKESISKTIRYGIDVILRDFPMFQKYHDETYGEIGDEYRKDKKKQIRKM